MTKISKLTPSTHRPKILLEAARICAKGYKRETMLPRLLGASPAQVVDLLQAREEGLEIGRRAHDATYSAQAHVEVLSALISEIEKAA
ncbi:MAG: DUF6477 family protein [Rhodobacteraceae bacterium]|nr:DUF6477 family protein [Paracoccaceae bacterium]